MKLVPLYATLLSAPALAQTVATGDGFDLERGKGLTERPVIIVDPLPSYAGALLTPDYLAPLTKQKMDLQKGAGFRLPGIVGDDPPEHSVSRIHEAVANAIDLSYLGPLTGQDLDPVRSALEGRANLQKHVDALDAVPVLAPQDLARLWERIVDALLDEALDDLAAAARAGEWDPVRFRYVRRMVHLRAQAAADHMSDEVAERLSALLRAMEVDGAGEAELRATVARDRLRRSKELVQRAEGPPPPDLVITVAAQRADLAKWTGME